MTSEGWGEMFEGDSANMCAVKFPLVSMGGLGQCPKFDRNFILTASLSAFNKI